MNSLASPSKGAHHRCLFLHEFDEIFLALFSVILSTLSAMEKTIRRVDILQRAHTNDLFKLLMSQLCSSNSPRYNAIVNKVRTMGNSPRRDEYNSSNLDYIHWTFSMIIDVLLIILSEFTLSTNIYIIFYLTQFYYFLIYALSSLHPKYTFLMFMHWLTFPWELMFSETLWYFPQIVIPLFFTKCLVLSGNFPSYYDYGLY